MNRARTRTLTVPALTGLYVCMSVILFIVEIIPYLITYSCSMVLGITVHLLALRVIRTRKYSELAGISI